MAYIELLLPLIFLTALLVYFNRSSFINPNGKKFRSSEGDIFLKGVLGLEILIVAIILMFLL